MIKRVANDSLARTYVSCALVLMNSLIALILFNLFLAIAYSILDAITAPNIAVPKLVASRLGWLFNQDGSPTNSGKRSGYQLEWFDFNAYENIEPSYAAGVLDDFYELSKLGFIYQPWVQFSEPPFRGELVNVDIDARGFPVRRTVNPPNTKSLPVIRIFTLGGSTTFGYNVSDEHTWPSHLSKILNDQARAKHLSIYVEVVNYGRGFYYPSQEAALVIDLLKNGHRPGVMIFMDGVNPGNSEDVPTFTEEFGRRFAGRQFIPDTPAVNKLRWVPIIRLAYAIRHRMFDVKTDTQAKKREPKADITVERLMNRVIQDWAISRAISNQYSVRSIFFLQPDASHNYPIHLWRRSLPESFLRDREWRIEFYRRMGNEKAAINLSNLFELWGLDRKAIVDDCHYSPSFNRFLAEHVARYIDIQTLAPRDSLIDESAATGFPRVINGS